MIVSEPPRLPPDTPNPDFWFNDQIAQLFFAAMNLLLTSRDGSIQHGDKAGNLSAVYTVFTSNATAGTEDTVPHTLGRIPIGYIVVRQDKAAMLYDGGTTWTATNLYLKSSEASVSWTILVF